MHVNDNISYFEISSKMENFYNPLNKYYYLTPEQRQKQRDIRERKNVLNSSSLENDHTPRSVVQKSKRQGCVKAKMKIRKRKLFREELKPFIPEILELSHECVLDTNSSEDKKFFKHRSPNHINKVSKMKLSYVESFIKRSRLRFGDAKCSSSLSIIKSKNSDELNKKSPEQNCDTLINISNSQGEQINLISEHSLQQPTKTEVGTYVMEDTCSTTNVSNKQTGTIIHNLEDSELTSSESFNVSSLSLIQSDLNQNSSQTLSPTLNSSQNLITVANEINDCSTTASPKLYPIFYQNSPKQEKILTTKSKVSKKSFSMRDTSKGTEQMILDAGQREIGPKQCKKCGMLYTIGETEDERIHANYHDKYLINLKFPGWKKERIVGKYEDGRVIQVLETDRNFKSEKIQDILEIVDSDLGFYSSSALPDINILLFISNDKRVRGCLVAESITSASPAIMDYISTAKDTLENGKVVRKLGSLYASSETVPAICGINRIWVDREYRRRKVASKLVDCLRSNFIYGHVVELQKLAFTDPTLDGREFAVHYTGTDSFLVYK